MKRRLGVAVQAGLRRLAVALAVTSVVDQQQVMPGRPGEGREVQASTDVLGIAVEKQQGEQLSRARPLRGGDEPAVDPHTVFGAHKDILERQPGRGRCLEILAHRIEGQPRLEDEDRDPERQDDRDHDTAGGEDRPHDHEDRGVPTHPGLQLAFEMSASSVWSSSRVTSFGSVGQRSLMSWSTCTTGLYCGIVLSLKCRWIGMRTRLMWFLSF